MFILLAQIFILTWLIRTCKNVLFWVYVWQLKEYHIGRFVDHFRTHKGQKIFLNAVFLAKILLFVLLVANVYILGLAAVLLAIYVVELLVFIKNVFSGDLRRPRFTLKTILLTLISFAAVVYVLFFTAQNHLSQANWQAFLFYLLGLDIFLPIMVSAIVLAVQPVFVFLRNIQLQKAKEKILQFPGLITIGITGSYGKTTTKEFLTTILSQKFSVLCTQEHQNSEMGISGTILNKLNQEHQIFIAEMGAYKKGGITLLCDIVKPKIGAVAGVNEQHLATFGSMENLLSAEGGKELLKALPKDGLLVLNGDNKYCVDLYRQPSSVHKEMYSEKVHADIWAEEVEAHAESISFLVRTKDGQMAHIDVAVLGRHNLQNILGAILVAKHLGMTLGEIADACKHIRQEQAGIALKKGKRGVYVIDSSYSANPDGVFADLDYLNTFQGRKIIIMPCLIELGEKSAHIHEGIGRKIAEICDLAIITTKDKFEEIKKGATLRGMPESNIMFSENPHAILHKIQHECKATAVGGVPSEGGKGDAVLLEGRVPGELIELLTDEKV